MIAVATVMLAALSSANAIAVLLNSPASTSPKAYAEAREVVLHDARAGKPLQQFVIGVTDSDKALAKRYLDASRARIRALAEEKNNPMAWYLLSMEKNDFTCLRRAADGGNVQAMNALGTVAIQRVCSDKSMPTNQVETILGKAFDYFNQAVLKHDVNALINLGTCYLRGFGCRQDLRMAYQCFRSAADAGHPEGMDYVSACYQNGHGVPIDDEKALYWRLCARAARGDEAAEKWLRERK